MKKVNLTLATILFLVTPCASAWTFRNPFRALTQEEQALKTRAKEEKLFKKKWRYNRQRKHNAQKALEKQQLHEFKEFYHSVRHIKRPRGIWVLRLKSDGAWNSTKILESAGLLNGSLQKFQYFYTQVLFNIISIIGSNSAKESKNSALRTLAQQTKAASQYIENYPWGIRRMLNTLHTRVTLLLHQAIRQTNPWSNKRPLIIESQ